MEKKDNKVFMLLSVIGILLVVFGHMINSPNLMLNNLFPIYSYHMALFIFISGYFFKDQKYIKYVLKKIKKLIIPYFLYRIFYGIIINILLHFSIINYGEKLSVYNIFVAPFTTHGNQYFFNVASCFVITLFFIQIIYMAIFKILKKFKCNNDYLLLFVFILMGCFSEKLDKIGINYTIIRVMFLLPFYQLGKIYKEKIEKYDLANNIIYFIVILCIQTILLQTGDLTYNLNLLRLDRNYIIFFIASITGIAFWLRISKILSKCNIADNKILNYIGNNTFTIMMNHVFSFFLLNVCAIIVHKINNNIFNNIDYEAFKESVWFVVGSHNNVGINTIYIIFAITFPLILKYVYLTYIKKKFLNIYLKLKNIEEQ